MEMLQSGRMSINVERRVEVFCALMQVCNSKWSPSILVPHLISWKVFMSHVELPLLEPDADHFCNIATWFTAQEQVIRVMQATDSFYLVLLCKFGQAMTSQHLIWLWVNTRSPFYPGGLTSSAVISVVNQGPKCLQKILATGRSVFCCGQAFQVRCLHLQGFLAHRGHPSGWHPKKLMLELLLCLILIQIPITSSWAEISAYCG